MKMRSRSAWRPLARLITLSSKLNSRKEINRVKLHKAIMIQHRKLRVLSIALNKKRKVKRFHPNLYSKMFRAQLSLRLLPQALTLTFLSRIKEC